MENNEEKKAAEPAVEEAQEGYVPRPAWQVRTARIGLVLFILFVIWQVFQIATGGLL